MTTAILDGWRLLAIIAVMLVTACGNDVQVAPEPGDAACPDFGGAERLSSQEFAALAACHYPTGDGWRVLTMRGRRFITHGPDVGRGSWSATVARPQEADVFRVHYEPEQGLVSGAVDGSTVEACAPADALSGFDSTAIIADVVARWGDSWEMGPDADATHGCVQGGTCDRIVVFIGDWISKHYVYGADGEYLYEASKASGCEDS